MLLLVFFFVSLIFYKVMPVLLLNTENTVISAILGAAVSTLIVYIATAAMYPDQSKPIETTKQSPPPKRFRFLKYFLGAAVATFLANYMIGYGFARDFRRRILDDPRDGELIALAFIYCTPVLIHYVIVAFEARRATSQR